VRWAGSLKIRKLEKKNKQTSKQTKKQRKKEKKNQEKVLKIKSFKKGAKYEQNTKYKSKTQ
jgi:hypothetical protein